MKIITTIILVLGIASLCHATTNETLSEEREVYLLHEGLYRVAKLSLKVLRSTDEKDAKVTDLRAEARSYLIVYLKEVEELKPKYDWPLLKDQLVEEVRDYLKRTEKGSPNQAFQVIGDPESPQPER